MNIPRYFPIVYADHKTLSHRGMPLVPTQMPGGPVAPLFSSRELLDDFFAKFPSREDVVVRQVTLGEFAGFLEDLSTAGIQYVAFDPPEGSAFRVGELLAQYRKISGQT